MSINDSLNIGIKLGGTFINIGLLDNSGDLKYCSPEISYKEILINNKNAYTHDDIYRLIFTELEKLLAKNQLTIDNLSSQQELGIYISFAGPINNKTNLVFRPKSIPCMKEPFNLKKEIKLYAKSFYSKKDISLKKVEVFVIHDAASSILGETSPKGTIPDKKDAMIFLSGTGVGAGFLKNGKPFYGKGINNLLGEIGYFLIFDGRSYEFIGYKINGNVHIPMKYETKKVFRHRFSTSDILNRYANLLLKSKNSYLKSAAKEYIASKYKSVYLCKKIAMVLSQEIQNNNETIIFVQSIGDELGLALATFISHPKHRNEKFIYNIVFGGSSSNLSVKYSKIIQESIRYSLYTHLKDLGFKEKKARLVSTGFVISHLDAKRELLGLGVLLKNNIKRKGSRNNLRH